MGKAVGFVTCYDAVIDRMKEHFQGIIRADAIGKDMYSVAESVYGTNLEYGMWLEFGGGEPDVMQPFRKPVWIWTIDGVLLIKYQGTDLETEILLGDRIDDLFKTFVTPNHAITDVTPFVKVAWIGKPDAVSVEDTPFYFLPFVVRIVDDRGG